MAAGAVNFPNALVRLPPCLLEDGQHPVDDVLLAVRESLFQHQPVPGVGDFAVDVKLELTGCGIAGPHRRRPVMARKPGRLPFGQVPLPLGL